MQIEKISTMEEIGISIQSLLLEILKKIEAKDIPYAVLTSATEKPPGVSSDVDLALAADPRSTVEPILRELQEQGEIEILQRLHYEVPAGFYYVLRPCQNQNLELLCLDCLFDPHRIGRYGVSTPALVAERVKEWWGYRASDADLALYYLRKRAAKATQFKLNLEPDQLDDLQNILQRADQTALARKAKELLGAESEELLGAIKTATTVAEARAAIIRVWKIWGRSRWKRHPVRWFHRGWQNLMRLTRRLLHPTGLFVVLVGPDGCGKSTIASAIAHSLLGVYRRTWRFHWRPGLLPKLARTGQRPGPGISEPPREAGYGTLVSLARYLYYLADFILGYWVQIYPRKVATTLVIGERWHYDVIVNPQRYGFRLAQWVFRLGQWLIPQPDLVFLLTASPLEVHQRKPELITAEIRSQIEEFRALLAHEPVPEVDTGVEVFESARNVQSAIVEETARLTNRRLKIISEWLGFGRRSGVKVWRQRKERAGQALQLYLPASMVGRLLKFAASILPKPLANYLFFRATPSPAEAAKLGQHTRVIRKVLGEPAATVSFGTGTPGPHRKMMAQATAAGRVQAYVKIDVDNALAELLDTEARALTAMEASNGVPFRCPRLLADITEQNCRYLFVSGPGEGARPRPLNPDRLDQLFLGHWIGSDSTRIPVEEILSQVPTPFATEVLEAQILSDALEFVRRAFQDSGVRVWPSHGDYAPWNTLLLPDGTLYVFDWEYFDDKAPALQDVFHRVFMPSRLLEGLSPGPLVRRLLAIRDDAILGQVVKSARLKDAEMSTYLMLYLLRLMSQMDFSDATSISFIIRCMRVLLLRSGFKGYRMRVLVSAYACEPDKGSEPGIGWNWAKQAARFHEVWVLTKANNRPSIEAEMRRHPDGMLHFSYLDLPRWATFWKKGEKGLHLYYVLWQLAAYKRAKVLHKEIGFDLSHHLTFGNVWLPTFLWKLPVPFIWGPLGGYETIPFPFWESFSLKWKLIEIIRFLLQFWARHIDPIDRMAGKKASSIIGRTAVTSSLLSHDFPDKVTKMVEYGVNRSDLENNDEILKKLVKNDSIDILMVGRMIHWKGFSIGIEAFQNLSAVNQKAKLHILGSGPEENNLRILCSNAGITENVIFHGQVPHFEVFSYFNNADIFLHPSLKDGTPTVIFEAMAAGLPVVCFDYTGPGELVTDSCGIKVLPNNPKQAVKEFAAALLRLAEDKTLRLSLGQGGRERLKEFLWEKKGDLLRELYLKPFTSQE